MTEEYFSVWRVLGRGGVRGWCRMPIKRGSWDRVIPHPPGVILLYGRWYRSSQGAILKNEGLRPDTKRDTLTQEGATPRGPLGGEYICTHNSTQRTSTFHLLTHQIRNSHKYVWMYFLSSDFQDLQRRKWAKRLERKQKCFQNRLPPPEVTLSHRLLPEAKFLP